MLAFALSFDEVIVTTFTAGQQATLPIWMLEELVRPRQRPVTNVVAMVVVLVTFLPILAAYYLTREGGDRGRRDGGTRSSWSLIPRNQSSCRSDSRTEEDHGQTSMLIGGALRGGRELRPRRS